jgi:hypothetical protein
MTTIINVQTVRLSDVQPEFVRWLWPGRIPLGKPTVLDGDPDNGKSTLTLDIAARVSRGDAMPDGARSEISGPAGVVLLSAEDGLADTIRPRLDAAGANPEYVSAITGTVGDDGYEHGFVLPDDLEWLRAEVETMNARLVVIDPLMAFLNSATNSFRDQDVRSALAPLSRMADETGAAIVIVRHLNKAPGGNPMYRGGGSIGIIGAARSGLLAARDPDDDSRRILAVTKSNLAEKPPAMAYRLEPAANGSVRIAWDGATDHNAGQLLAGPRDDEERTARDDAKTLLAEALADGPVAVTVLRKQWRDAGISDASARRAKSDMGIGSVTVGNPKHGGYWAWQLPTLSSCSHGGEHLESEHLEKPRQNHENGHKQALDVHLNGYEHLENSAPLNPAHGTNCRDCGYGPLSASNQSALCGRCLSRAVNEGRYPVLDRSGE